MRHIALGSLVMLAATLAHAQGTLALPAHTSAARRLPFDRRQVVDCGAHGAWTPPSEWTVVTTDTHHAIALSPDATAMLVRAGTRSAATHVRSTDAFRAAVVRIVTELAGTAPTLGEVEEQRRSRWHVNRRVEGTAGAAHVRATSDGERRLWIVLTTSAAHDAELDLAIASWLSLVDHACVCGDDCDRRPAPAPSE